MSAGVQTVKEFGPAEFFKITSLAIYDVNYANKYISKFSIGTAPFEGIMYLMKVLYPFFMEID